MANLYADLTSAVETEQDAESSTLWSLLRSLVAAFEKHSTNGHFDPRTQAAWRVIADALADASSFIGETKGIDGVAVHPRVSFSLNEIDRHGLIIDIDGEVAFSVNLDAFSQKPIPAGENVATQRHVLVWSVATWTISGKDGQEAKLVEIIEPRGDNVASWNS